MEEIRDQAAVTAWRKENLGSARVDVQGLREFQKQLREIERTLPRELRLAGNEAAEVVVDEAVDRANALGGVAAKAARSLRAASGQREAAVKLGGAAYPFALGAEFGGGLHGRGNPTARGGYTTQFLPWRGNQWTFRGLEFSQHATGYFLHPAIRDKQADVVEAYGRAVDRLALAAFPD